MFATGISKLPQCVASPSIQHTDEPAKKAEDGNSKAGRSLYDLLFPELWPEVLKNLNKEELTIFEGVSQAAAREVHTTLQIYAHYFWTAPQPPEERLDSLSLNFLRAQLEETSRKYEARFIEQNLLKKADWERTIEKKLEFSLPLVTFEEASLQKSLLELHYCTQDRSTSTTLLTEKLNQLKCCLSSFHKQFFGKKNADVAESFELAVLDN